MPISTTLVILRSRMRQPARVRPRPRPASRRCRSRASMIWPTISPGGEVAHQALRAGMAERAGQRAADLARDAQRAAVFLGDIDGLDLLAVGKPKQPFARAVDRDLLGHDLGPRQREARGQFAAQLLGDVGHGGEIGRAAHIEPAPELAHAHARLPLRHAKRGEARGELGAAKPDQRLGGRRSFGAAVRPLWSWDDGGHGPAPHIMPRP